MIPLLTSHLWQSTFFAILAGLLTVAFRGNRAQIRYWLWLSASLKFFVPFALLVGLGSHLENSATRQIATRITTAPAIAYTMEQFRGPLLPERLPAATPTTGTIHWIPFAILGLWLCGFLVIARMRLRSWRRVRSAVRGSTPINILATVEVRVSPGLLEPGVVGLLHPILLLPDGIAQRLTPSELKAVLAHELCHVRRCDNLFAAIHMIVEMLFWFHPLVWWIGARLVEERERACDEEVLSLGNQPDVYADAILNVCKLYVESPLVCVSGVSGASIRRRIEVIMSNRKLQGLNGAKKLLLATAGVAALGGPIAIGLLIGVGNIPVIHAQQPASALPSPIRLVQAKTLSPQTAPLPPAARPKFDAVSIRRCMPGDELTGPPGGRGGGGAGRGPRYSPGRLRMQCLALDDLILTAYIDRGMSPLLNFTAYPNDSRWLRNAPAWVKTDWYTIDAETDDPVANGPTGPGKNDAREVMNQMLQAVLEDRFQLKTHRDTEDVPMYNLTVAKGGLKLKPMEPGGCVERDPTKIPDGSEPAPAKPQCVSWLHTNGPDWAIDETGRPLDGLARALSDTLGRHVFDKTGVRTVFSFKLQFAHDENTPGGFTPEVLEVFFPHTDAPAGPSIFTALEGIGLKLEATKGPQGIVVVDHVERPSEN